VQGAFVTITSHKSPQLIKGTAELVARFFRRKVGIPAYDIQAPEILANAFLSIEYYLDEIGRRRIADNSILLVPDNSASTLWAMKQEHGNDDRAGSTITHNHWCRSDTVFFGIYSSTSPRF
jgi:hypothetical protein